MFNRLFLCKLVLLTILFGFTFEVVAMTFTIGDRLKNGQELTEPAILAEGDIVVGDAERLFRFLLTNRDRIEAEHLPLVPSSNGGSVSEALKMAQILDGGMYSVWLPPDFSGKRILATTKCVSACFALVVGATSRKAIGGALGLHRPYLSKSSHATLSVKDAQSIHEQSLAELRSWLQYKGVPNALIDRMMSTPSTEVHWMSKDEVDVLGKNQVWAEEMMIARCNFEPRLFESWSDAATKGDDKTADILNRQLVRQGTCVRSIILERRNEFLSRRPAFLTPKR